MKNRDKLHLLHIKDAIDKVEGYTRNIGLEEFIESEKTQDAVLMQFIVIGEAVNNLSDEYKEKNPNIPWHQAVGLRNQTAHGYFDIEPNIVWRTIKDDLPELKGQLKSINNQ